MKIVLQFLFLALIAGMFLFASKKQNKEDPPGSEFVSLIHRI